MWTTPYLLLGLLGGSSTPPVSNAPILWVTLVAAPDTTTRVLAAPDTTTRVTIVPTP